MLVHTVDIITPVVNDPYLWGAISAANSLSDVYAMGCYPLTALAIVGFNSCEMSIDILKEVLKGACKKLEEAGTVLLGGHTLDDREPKFGLAVTGVCPDGTFLTQKGARPKDILFLTKPIGTGIVVKGIKERVLKEEKVSHVIENMLKLNYTASKLAKELGATACTDVTGFGLLGHALNISRKSGVRLTIDASSVPVYEVAYYLVQQKVYPKGAVDNYQFVKDQLNAPHLQWWELLLLTDPVTSGGLLFTVPEDRALLVEERARDLGVDVWRIGWVEEGSGLRVIKTQTVPSSLIRSLDRM